MKAFLVLLCLSVSCSHQTSLQEVTAPTNRFASVFYKEFAKIEKENFLVSPFSAEVIFALTQSGARGNTSEELRKAFNLPNNDDQIKEHFSTLLSSLRSENFVLTTANKIYVREGIVIKNEFQEIAKSVYKAELESIDFVKSEEAREVINSWMKNETFNKIENLIAPGILTRTTATVLVNALYLKAEWFEGFDKNAITKQNFYLADNKSVQVEYFGANGRDYQYYESSELNATCLRIPFKGKEGAVVFVLPNEKQGLSTLESRIDDVLSAPNWTVGSIDVVLPKFKIGSEIDLKVILSKLGVEEAFGPKADFSGMAGERGDLFITAARQKTFIDVNENGVEATASTFVVTGIRSGAAFSKRFMADHPFLFYVEVKGVILFVGRVVEPKY